MLTWLKPTTILLALTALLALGGYVYYSHTSSVISNLESQVVQLATSNMQLKNTLEYKLEEQKQIAAQFEKAKAEFARIDSDIDAQKAELRSAINSGIINAITVDMNRCFELLSGVELNDKERAATSPKEFNSQCPWLYSNNR